MKSLTLLRHAKSSWDGGVTRDFDRPLNKRGRKAARIVGGEMRRLGLVFDRVIASPAARVTETIDAIEDGYGGPLETAFDKRVYLASTGTLLDLIHEIDDGADSALIVGHNPGLEQLALLLTKDDGSALRPAITVKYPTATLAEISLPVDRWSAVSEGKGAIARFIRPRDLDPELGPEEEAH